MPTLIDHINLPLFVPADRPDRFAKAAAAGADAVIVDLEDAVAPDARATGRAGLVEALKGIEAPIVLRSNAAGTAWFDGDLILARSEEIT
ncbi:hypothetical protein D6850_16635 [Roseovarius spongiae]|uniref:HpcH/HpaI aldolase/citrate lyase domain-containing protein n=1 Tax=Roseovarius spongiae TaxID=2320272 RepID=A0A3A8B3W1_9RHOB|nr:aldolase/citrate lyase family protein [Roseovarius spongiae]RKF12594.1 hypothetical protein D6850_16635 [Roseovarius spongiae]